MLRYRRALRGACEKCSSNEHERKQTHITPLTVEELREAQLEIIKIVQERSFTEEIAVMLRNLMRMSCQKPSNVPVHSTILIQCMISASSALEND
jgi:hypothetical protein